MKSGSDPGDLKSHLVQPSTEIASYNATGALHILLNLHNLGGRVSQVWNWRLRHVICPMSGGWERSASPLPAPAVISVPLLLEHTDLKTADGRGGASPPKATQANLGLEIRVLTIHQGIFPRHVFSSDV